MNRPAVIAALSLLFVGGVKAVEAPSAQDQQMLALVKEIQGQQAKMAENQAALEKKLATVAEAVRIARIYATRAGR